MPYKSERIKIAGTEFDRRRKLSDEDGERVKELYKTGEFSQRKLANMFGVSRRLVTFILDPEKDRRNKERAKELRKEGRYRYTKEEWAAVQREHRRYKHQLHTEGKI